MASSSVRVWRRLREGFGPGVLDHPAAVDRLLDRGHHQLGVELGHTAVPELEDLGEVVAGVDVHDREGQAGRPEGLLGQPEHHDRVLAPREQQHRALELGHHLTHDVDRLGLEGLEMGQLVLPGPRTSPHRTTRIAWPCPFPIRSSGSTLPDAPRLQGANLATTDDDELAARIAEEAGRVLLDLRRDMGLDDAKALGREGDRRSNELIMAALRRGPSR